MDLLTYLPTYGLTYLPCPSHSLNDALTDVLPTNILAEYLLSSRNHLLTYRLNDLLPHSATHLPTELPIRHTYEPTYLLTDLLTA